MKETLQAEPSDSLLWGKWINYQILLGSDGGGQLNPVTENLKALPFFISLREPLPVVIKTPVLVPVSLHFRSLTFIWIFVPMWDCWELFPPHLTDEERKVCDIKWFAQVTQKVSDGVYERKSPLLSLVLHSNFQRKPCKVSRMVWYSALLLCQDQEPRSSL